MVGGEQEFLVTKQVCPCRGLLFPFAQMPFDNPGEVKMRPGGRYLSLSLAPLNDNQWIRGDYCLQTFQKGKQQNIKHVQVASMYSLLPVYKTYQ